MRKFSGQFGNNVRPKFPANDGFNCRGGNAKFMRQGINCYNEWLIGFSYLTNLGFRELGISILRTILRFVSAFFISIFHVFNVRSKKKVFGINAKSGVAFMENVETHGNSPIMDYPRSAMTLKKSICLIGSTSHSEVSISPICCTAPNPTRIRFFYVAKESFRKRHLNFEWHKEILPCR